MTIKSFQSTKSFVTAIALLFSSAFALHAVDVKIDWGNPSSYSDMEEDNRYSERVFERFKGAIETVLKTQASKHLPEGATLHLTIKDVDLAGEFEYWVSPTYDVRSVRDIYPPRIKFQYKIVGANGETLKKGLAQETDLTYLWNIERAVHNSDEFFYEKQLVRDWARDHLDEVSQKTG